MKQRFFKALILLGFTSMAQAGDSCSTKLDAYLSDWEKSIKTYSLRPVRENFSRRLEVWKRRRAGEETDCAIWQSLPEQRAKREATKTLSGSTSAKTR